MLLVWSWLPPFFAPKGVDRPWILAFTASALRGRLAVGTYSNLSAPPGVLLQLFALLSALKRTHENLKRSLTELK